MKKIGFINKKGGVGKTSVAGAAAVEMARSGKKVLALDCDGQGNLSSWLLGDAPLERELADVLFKQCEWRDALVRSPVDNLFVMPTISVGGNMKLYEKTRANESPFAMRQLLRKAEEEAFDVALIDCPPNFLAVVESCMLACDEAVVVIDLTEFSKDGLIQLKNNIDDLQERFDTDRPKMEKVVFNKRDLRLSVQNHIMTSIEKDTAGAFKFYTVPVDQAFGKAQVMKVPVQDVEDAKPATLETIKTFAADLAEEI